MDRKEKVYAYICSKNYVPLKQEELVTVLGVPAEDVPQLIAILEELEQEGRIFRSKRGRYLSAQREQVVAGIYTSSERGYGFVTPLEEGARGLLYCPGGRSRRHAPRYGTHENYQ